MSLSLILLGCGIIEDNLREKITELRFSEWGLALNKYKDFNGYFPPFLLGGEEGVPVSLQEEVNRDAFIVALTGKRLNRETKKLEEIQEEDPLK